MQISKKCLFSSHMAHPAIHSLSRFPWHNGCQYSREIQYDVTSSVAEILHDVTSNAAEILHDVPSSAAEILHAVTSSAAVLLKRAKSNSGRYIPDDDRDDHDDKKIEQLN